MRSPPNRRCSAIAAEGRLKRKTSIQGPGNCQNPSPSLRARRTRRRPRRRRRSAPANKAARDAQRNSANPPAPAIAARIACCQATRKPDARRDQRRADEHRPDRRRRALCDSGRRIHSVAPLPSSVAHSLRKGARVASPRLQRRPPRRVISAAMCRNGVSPSGRRCRMSSPSRPCRVALSHPAAQAAELPSQAKAGQAAGRPRQRRNATSAASPASWPLTASACGSAATSRQGSAAAS